MKDDYKNPKAGEELKTSTLVMLGFGFFSIIIFSYFASIVQKNGFIFIIVGIVIALFCILLYLPNLKRFFIGKKREHMLKTGKLKEEATKSYNKEHRFGD